MAARYRRRTHAARLRPYHRQSRSDCDAGQLARPRGALCRSRRRRPGRRRAAAQRLRAQGAGAHDARYARLPIVAVGERIRGAKFPQVEVDNRAAARMAVEYLVGLGHKRIAYLSGRLRSHLDSARRMGFRDALAGAEGLEWTGDYYFASGVAAAEAMLRAKPRDRPTALFAASDEMAIGFLKTIHAAGLAVPRDMSIVGFDGIDYARFSEPALTTVFVPRRQIGETAGDMLADLMTGSADVPAHVRLATELLVRGSTGPAPGPR
ncbi:MAG: hypothetical protein C6Y20_10335 [Tagaea sp. CACIAM 22H2]|nr:hypothetical protein [Tagaea sp. CACIAM 22H2]